MTPAGTPGAPPRSRTTQDWVEAGDNSLRNHLHAQALVAHHRYAPFTPARLPALLGDSRHLRHPTRLVFEFGDMAPHQFAQPDFDLRNPEQDGRVLYLRPCLRQHPERILQAIAYMIPVINYGEIVGDEHCLLYGATLLGLLEQEFYQQVCDLADFVGAEPRVAGSATQPHGCHLPAEVSAWESSPLR